MDVGNDLTESVIRALGIMSFSVRLVSEKAPFELHQIKNQTNKMCEYRKNLFHQVVQRYPLQYHESPSSRYKSAAMPMGNHHFGNVSFQFGLKRHITGIT